MPYFKDLQNNLHHIDDVSFYYLLPAGCVEITDAAAFAIQHPATTLAEVQAAALAAIDAAAGAARARYITVTAGQEATYMLKEAQSRTYKSSGYPSSTVADYPMVEAEAKAINGAAPTATQIQAAADGIVAQADAWIAKAAEIERVRIAGKRAVTAQADTAGVDAARDAAVAEMDAL